MDPIDGHAYRSAREGAAFYAVPRPGCLRIEGEDRLAFLQRQTTNDLSLLSPERAVLTVLTSPTARILDVFYVLHEPQALSVITLPGRAQATARYLRSRIFFMDKVTLEDASPVFAQVDLLGPQCAALVARLGVRQELETGRVVRLAFQGADLRLWALPAEFAPGCRILLPAEAIQPLTAELQAGGAALLGEREYQTLRVEAGAPAVEAELSEAFTPLEAGLSLAVSGQKGCYTGQEVLARQTTYDKVTQRLCGLKLSAPASAGASLQSEDGRPAGKLTSFAASPRFGPIGLAVVRRPYEAEGTGLLLAEEGGGQARAEVVSLPF